MIAAVADTHTILWYLYGDQRLSRTAKKFIDDAAIQGVKIGISAISLVEAVYLVEENRIPADAYAEIKRVLNDPSEVFEEMPVDQQIVDAMQRIIREEIPDLPDRIVAATALDFGVAVLSCDGRIRTSAARTIW